MRRLIELALLILVAACTQHSDGTCVWVPGDDGTCSGRSSGCSGGEEPPPAVDFATAAVSAHRVVVLQGGAEGEHLWTTTLDASGLPESAIAPLRIAPAGKPELWNGPDGGALLTMTSYQGGAHPFGIHALPLRPDGSVIGDLHLTGEIPYQLAVVFDGGAYLIAWREWSSVEQAGQIMTARVLADGTLAWRRVAVRFDVNDGYGAFQLATDGTGGALLTWTVRLDWRLVADSAPGELRGLRFQDGIPIDVEPIILATDGAAGCLRGDTHALVRTGGIYRALVMRYACPSGAGARALRDVAIDPETALTDEQASPLPFTQPPALIPGGDGGFLAIGERRASLVDASLLTATPAWEPAGSSELILAVAGTDTGYAVATFTNVVPGATDVVTLGTSSPARVTVATSYVLPDDGGCSAGHRTELAPVLVALLVLGGRRRPGVSFDAPRRGKGWQGT